jgi:putative acetyltransferase
MSTHVIIRAERAEQPQAVALLDAPDACPATLHTREANHILSVEQLLAPDVSFCTAWQGGRSVGTGVVRRMAVEPGTGGVPFEERL